MQITHHIRELACCTSPFPPFRMEMPNLSVEDTMEPVTPDTPKEMICSHDVCSYSAEILFDGDALAQGYDDVYFGVGCTDTVYSPFPSVGDSELTI